jgi:hypothetical protein
LPLTRSETAAQTKKTIHRVSNFHLGRSNARLTLRQISNPSPFRGDNDQRPSGSPPRKPPPRPANWRTPLLIIGFGCLISLMSFGPPSSLGFFLTPMSAANHWGRDVFACIGVLE